MDLIINNLPDKDKVKLELWAKYTVEKWQFAIAKYGKVSSRQLLNSFTYTISQQSEGSAAMISFAFEFYLRMIDMGVGKGTPLGDAKTKIAEYRAMGKQSGFKLRKPYPVYSRILYSEVMRLTELLANQYGKMGINLIIDEFKHGNDEATKYNID